jgi:hypothetical protein
MKGRLQDMAVADLIQHNCQDRKTARIQLRNGRAKGELFIKNGNVVHAAMDNVKGEEAVYRMMEWGEGTFELSGETEAPAVTITRNWTSLLLEAARLADESGLDAKPTAYFTEPEEAEIKYERSGDLILDLGIVSPQQVLEQLAQKIEGHLFTCVTRPKGDHLYWMSSKATNREQAAEQVNQLVKMAELATARLQAGELQNLALITESAYLFIRFLGSESFYLCIAADKAKVNPGNLRYQAGIFAERMLPSLEADGAL